MTNFSPSVEPGGVGTPPSVAAASPQTAGTSGMRSLRGFLGSIVLLLALPVAVLTQVLFGSGSGIAIHFALALGCVLVASAAFDFETPRWMAWICCVSAGAFAAIFLVQNASALVGNVSFSYFANEVLGLWGEKALLSSITFWLVGVLLTASRGKSRILGFLVMAMVVGVDLYVNFALVYLGTNPFMESPVVKLAYLLPFVWLMFESSKREPRKGSHYAPTPQDFIAQSKHYRRNRREV
ncbi:MAG TPA: hypothetical protein VK902_02400 [Rubrobacter sp.]|nr:hypothetical protein [Rubrobacter sp.]